MADAALMARWGPGGSAYSGGSSPMGLTGNSSLLSILAQLNGGQQGANDANKSRFNDILAGREAEKTKLLNDVQTYGTGQRNRIRSDYDTLGRSSLANLASRGLASSSLDTTTRLGVERRKQDALGSLEDQLLGKRIDLERGLNEGIFGFKERRNDTGPDLNSILPLLQQFGQSQSSSSSVGINPFFNPSGGINLGANLRSRFGSGQNVFG